MSLNGAKESWYAVSTMDHVMDLGLQLFFVARIKARTLRCAPATIRP